MPRKILFHKRADDDYSILIHADSTDAQSLCTYLNNAGASCSMTKTVAFLHTLPALSVMRFDPRGKDIEDLVLDWMGTGTPKDIRLSSDRAELTWEYEPANIRRYLISRMQQFRKRFGHGPTRISISLEIEAAITSHLMSEGGEWAAKIRESGLRDSMAQIFGLTPTFDSGQLRFE